MLVLANKFAPIYDSELYEIKDPIALEFELDESIPSGNIIPSEIVYAEDTALKASVCSASESEVKFT